MGMKCKDPSEHGKLITPGAGTYEPVSESQKPKAANYSMAAKLKSELVKKDNVPGPGTYVNSSEKLKTASPNYGFGSSKRPDIGGKTFKTPGPGSYRVTASIGERWV